MSKKGPIVRGEWSGSEGLEREGRRWEGYVDKHRPEFPPVISLSTIWVSVHSRRLLTWACQYQEETIHVHSITFPNPTIVCITISYALALFLNALPFPHILSVCVFPHFLKIYFLWLNNSFNSFMNYLKGHHLIFPPQIALHKPFLHTAIELRVTQHRADRTECLGFCPSFLPWYVFW